MTFSYCPVSASVQSTGQNKLTFRLHERSTRCAVLCCELHSQQSTHVLSPVHVSYAIVPSGTALHVVLLVAHH